MDRTESGLSEPKPWVVAWERGYGISFFFPGVEAARRLIAKFGKYWVYVSRRFEKKFLPGELTP
jgi:hypothetical protein